MWDPNETLAAAWARDDDVVSWRSLDTLRGVEIDPLGRDALEDSASDVSDGEELVETIDRRKVPPVVHLRSTGFGSGDQLLALSQPTERPFESERRPPHRPISGDLTLRELPSTSEMVSIREPTPVAPRHVISRDSKPPERPESESYATDSIVEEPFLMPVPRVDSLQRSPGQLEARRVSMTLGDLLAQKKAGEGAFLLPPPAPLGPVPLALAPTVPPKSIDAGAHFQEMKLLERRCEDLVEKERHLQTVLAKQLHQIETMDDQMRLQDTKFQSQQLELSGLKEQLARVERQNASLQSALREKEQAQDQHTQLLVQKTNELSALETKVRSLQITNESFQEQARKATEEKEKTHKDYLQVVYDLGKLQKQMNAAAKETVNVAEKDLLLREIDQLRHEKDQLSAKLKENEARKTSLLQNNAAVEAQKLRELQSRVRELEEDLQRARGNSRAVPSQNQQSSYTYPSTAPAPMQKPPQPPFSSFDAYPSTTQHDLLRNSMASAASYSQQDPLGMPSLLSGMPSGSSGTRPMTLKALARRSTSIGDMLRSQDPPPSSDFSSFVLPPNPAVSAPFATEKQTLLQDSMQKRDLEQKLLKLHVEKEQMEAKLIKVEQTGLKTMSARTEKAWLESRLRDLTLEISRLKLSLR